MTKSFSIAVLLTCHNRREKTIACLESLFVNPLPKQYHLDVFLVDDGSTDGTGDMVKERFPSVNVIQGAGSLYWNGGMRLAWETATSLKKFDFYLWLNDDTILLKKALITLVDKGIATLGNHILVGATRSPKGDITYSGYRYFDTKLTPDGSWQFCDYFNGNIVLVPSLVFKKVGFLDRVYRHALGDFDYGIRAKKLGFVHLLAPEALGVCDGHDRAPIWRNSDYPIGRRFRHLYSPLGNNPFEFFIFDKRQNGIYKALIHFLSIHLRLIFPKL
jgi:GT2 family glycosyltransferase